MVDQGVQASTRCALQVEQQQQILTRKQEQAQSAREVLQQLKSLPEPDQQIDQLILQQNQSLYLARVLQVCLPAHHSCLTQLSDP